MCQSGSVCRGAQGDVDLLDGDAARVAAPEGALANVARNRLQRCKPFLKNIAPGAREGLSMSGGLARQRAPRLRPRRGSAANRAVEQESVPAPQNQDNTATPCSRNTAAESHRRPRETPSCADKHSPPQVRARIWRAHRTQGRRRAHVSPNPSSCMRHWPLGRIGAQARRGRGSRLGAWPRGRNAACAPIRPSEMTGIYGTGH